MRWTLAAIVLATAALAPPALAQSQLTQPDQCSVHAREMQDTQWPGGMAALMQAGEPRARVERALGALAC